MIELERADSVAREAAILVGVLLPEQQRGSEHPLDELEGLARTAGAQVVGRLTQKRERPSVATYLGKGKVQELKLLGEAHEADVVIFDNDLSPSQTRNLEKELDLKVLDRTELILDIFASRAQTYEARLAVELAQLEYSLPRLKRMWTHLSRLKMGIGMRGPGEKQLEVDRRLVEKRIHDLRTELDGIHRRKERQVAARRGHRTVSLVGYTNAGKSTLLNTLTGASERAEDKLFATLDTRTRRWFLPGWGPVLLSDTVGFIRDLPHSLIASFKATLEEARQANLLMHVADASDPEAFQQISSVFNVLKELGIEEKDTLLVLNKVDNFGKDDTAGRHQLDGLLNRYPSAIPISARSGKGLDDLAQAVSDALSRSFLDLDVETGVANGKLQAFLAANGEVFSTNYDESDRVVIHCRLPEHLVAKVREQNGLVREHAASMNGAPNSNGEANAHEMSDGDATHEVASHQMNGAPENNGETHD